VRSDQSGSSETARASWIQPGLSQLKHQAAGLSAETSMSAACITAMAQATSAYSQTLTIAPSPVSIQVVYSFSYGCVVGQSCTQRESNGSRVPLTDRVMHGCLHGAWPEAENAPHAVAVRFTTFAHGRDDPGRCGRGAGCVRDCGTHNRSSAVGLGLVP
jgi:hypothetical protein